MTEYCPIKTGRHTLNRISQNEWVKASDRFDKIFVYFSSIGKVKDSPA